MASKYRGWRRERSYGAVIYREKGGRRKYLMLRNVQGHWDFCKGRGEAGETPERTIRREVREESGISGIEMVPGFIRRMRWSFRRGAIMIRKTALFRIARTNRIKVRLSCEHDCSRWVSAAQGLKLIKFANARGLLRAAEGFLSRRSMR